MIALDFSGYLDFCGYARYKVVLHPSSLYKLGKGSSNFGWVEIPFMTPSSIFLNQHTALSIASPIQPPSLEALPPRTPPP
jgi:hypothetical protein